MACHLILRGLRPQRLRRILGDVLVIQPNEADINPSEFWSTYFMKIDDVRFKQKVLPVMLILLEGSTLLKQSHFADL